MARPHFRIFPLASIVLLLCGLAACHREPTAPPNTTPEGAVRADLVLTRNGDFDRLLRSTLPARDYQAWRAEWEKARAGQAQPTPEQRAQFAQTMQNLTESGAEDKLYRQLEPKLADFRKHQAQNLPMLIGILQAAGNHTIDNAAGLSDAQKDQARQAMAALATWAQTADFTDPKKVKQAIGVICDTARRLDVTTLDQLRGLDYGQTMARYRTGWDGLKQLLQIYGLDLNASFDSAKLQTLSNDGTHAKVRESFTLAGKPIVSDVNLVKISGDWYDADRLAAWRERHEGAIAPSAATASVMPPAAPASTTRPPPASTAASH